MATSSLEQSFEIDDPKLAEEFLKDLDSPEDCFVPKIDTEAEEEKAAQLLTQRFSKLG